MNRRRPGILAACVGAAACATSVCRVAFPDETIRLADTYAPYRLTPTADHRRQAAEFARATAGEAPLARMERLAHDYAYGDSQGAWDDPQLLARLRADGFSIVETVRDPDDGFAAMLVKDERTGRHVPAMRGTDDAGWSNYFTGKGDVWTDLGEVTTGVNVGITQFENTNHAKWLAGIARSYGRDGKLDVTGHSLGGALSNLFAASYPEVVNRVITFQAPAVSEAVWGKYESKVGRLSPADRPWIEATVAADDPVSLAGTHYLSGTIVHAVAMSDQASSVLGNHTAFLWQSPELKKADGEQYAPRDRVTAVTDFRDSVFASLRKGFVIDGLVNPGAVDERRKNAAAVVDALVLQRVLEDEWERLQTATDPAETAAIQKRVNRLWETAEASSKKLAGRRGLETVADLLQRRSDAAVHPELRKWLADESALCRKASQTLKRRDELALSGDTSLDAAQRLDRLKQQATDEYRERRRAFSQRMQVEVRDRKEQTEKFERRAVEFAKHGLKPRDPNAPLDPDEAKPIIPDDCMLEIAVGDPTGGRAYVDAYHALGGVVTATRPTRIAPEKNGPGFWDAEERYPYAFAGRMLDNELVGQWVTSSPEEGKRWSKSRLDQHSVGRTTHTDRLRIVLFADGTASWESETTTVRELHALVGVFDSDTGETETYRTTAWPKQSGSAVWRIGKSATASAPAMPDELIAP
ncbi:MAG: hypothetical protein JNL96_07195 [Planctomycetaceae bacterium]|nr:hypothetical protein [Planctomycetaceae bacterium]